LVTNALSNSLNSKLSTSSYSTDSASFNSRIISGSAVAGTISGSQQISALGFVTGSYTTINSFNSLTQSFNSISQSFTTISGSVGNVNFSGLISSSAQITAFGFISSSQTIDSGSLVTTSSFNSYTASISTASLVTSISNLNTTTSSLNISVNALNTATSSYEIKGRGIWSGSAQLPTGVVSGSAQTILNLPTGVVSGSTQLTTAFPSKTTGAWSVPAGASTQSFTVEAGASYTMWVNGNIPNGIITWNATVTTSNTNVPVVGSQYGWYYTPGNALVLTAIPDQIIGTNGSIANTPTSYAPNTSNVFKFGITNNSGASQTINYGYIKLS